MSDEVNPPPNLVPPPPGLIKQSAIFSTPLSLPSKRCMNTSRVQFLELQVSLEERSQFHLLFCVGSNSRGMGHSCRRCCISSIRPCNTHIFKMFLWIKFLIWQRSEADNLTLTPCVPELVPQCLVPLKMSQKVHQTGHQVLGPPAATQNQIQNRNVPCSQQKAKLNET